MLKVVLALAAFAGAFTLFYTSLFTGDSDGASYPRTYHTSTVRTITLTDAWTRYFDLLFFRLPVLIVDEELLLAILVEAQPQKDVGRKLRVAVDEKLRGSPVSDNDDKLDVIYYSKATSERDYWRFQDDERNETRTMLPLNLYASSPLVSFPSDVRGFIDDWRASRFIECHVLLNRTAGEKRTISLSFLQPMADLRDFIRVRKARIMLAGGSLLGWFRECSLIPHTSDIDFFIRSEEYNPSIREDLDARVSPYKLFRIYGLPDDSYELSINVKKYNSVNVDLFFLYTNEKESWVGGLAWYTRKKYKWTYPRITEVCTADLLGHLFHVPCNVEAVLDMEYGEWRKDAPTKNFVWYKSHSNVKEDGMFSKEDLKKMRAFG